MGLCRCRAVTGAFCFEHRRNVCDRCVVLEHGACHVAPYLQWLSDSATKPDCLLCHAPLAEQKAVRLPCYHRFHGECVKRRFEGREWACPDCHESADKAGPIGDELKRFFGLLPVEPIVEDKKTAQQYQQHLEYAMVPGLQPNVVGKTYPTAGNSHSPQSALRGSLQVLINFVTLRNIRKAFKSPRIFLLLFVFAVVAVVFVFWQATAGWDTDAVLSGVRGQ